MVTFNVGKNHCHLFKGLVGFDMYPYYQIIGFDMGQYFCYLLKGMASFDMGLYLSYFLKEWLVPIWDHMFVSSF